MKKPGLLAFAFLICLQPFAQNFPGYRSGNYTGVNGVFFNPASIADSRYRYDINLFGIHGAAANNNASLKLKNLNDAFTGEADSILFGRSDKNTNGAIAVDLFGPSFMVNLSKKTSIALSTRVRAMANIVNLDGNFLKSINNEFDGSLPYSLISSNKQKLAINGWTDFGASIGQILFDNGKHFIKGGLTLKYLAGSGNSYANISQLKATIDKDGSNNVFLSEASGSVGIGSAGIDIDNFEAKDALKFNGSGFGGDIGFIYEYRPEGDNLKDRYQNKYKLKIGIALLDIGSIRYTPNADKYETYNIDVAATEEWHPEDIDGSSISDIKNYLDGSPYFTKTNEELKSYRVMLPANLQANADYLINKNFYIELAGQFNLAKKDNAYSSFYSSSVSLTPRYERSHFGFYLPLSYNELTHFNAGVSFRLGPVFFGSGSILTMLFDQSKQADAHFGVKLGGLFKKAKKQKPTFSAPPPAIVKVVADRDKDGIDDEQDSCPEVPGPLKYKGCPVPDTDGDGINDDMDACPTQKGLEKYKGCPIPDTDNDGINDDEDKCLQIPGVPKYDGCPVPDTDGDGINDEDDKCPTLPGVAANNGCPEIKEEIVKKMTFAAHKIYFITGKSVLLSKSFPAMNEVIKILNATPGLQLQIDGYTDNIGKAASNQLLSEKRALAVKNYLVGKGVKESRITCKGHGAENPVADNKTAAGRTKNRRVELKLNY